MTLQGYYNRFNSADNYDNLLFRASRGLQSAELNEIQSILSDRIQKIAGILFKDGAVVRDASVNIDAASGNVDAGAGALYVAGAVREVAATSFQIPTSGTLAIGVRVHTFEVTELEDPDLRDPATGTRNYNEPGAGRTRRIAEWGWSGDGNPGEFYAVYQVADGALITQSAPPEIDGVKQLIARYDREANGNYVVNGLNVVSLGKNDASTHYLFSVLNGTGNLQGHKIDKPVSVTIPRPIDPDLQTINNEPRNSTTVGTQTITLGRKPLNDILDVVITAEKTITLSHGAFTGAADALPDNAVLSIEEITQSGTTYVNGSDFVLNNDTVDWSLPGAEPAPGTTYSVTYRYITSVTPTNINGDEGTFEVTGAVAQTLVLTDYRWKVPRVDTIVMRGDGTFTTLKGIASRFNPVPPQASDSELVLASIYYDWFQASEPGVNDMSTRVIDMQEQKAMKESITELYKIVAETRMLTDISNKEPSSKYGIFTDNFFDEDQRDGGLSQTAVIVEQELQPPANAVVISQPNTNATVAQLLPYQETFLLEQPLFSGEMKINPYQAFEPMPAKVVLSPAVDQWTETDSQTTSVVQYLWYPWYYWGYWHPYYGWYYNWYWSYYYGWYYPYYWYYAPRTTTSLVSRSEQKLPYLRQRSIDFTVSGFGGGEILDELLFDGRQITQSYVANSDGEIQGSFTIPANIPAGQKLVEFRGRGGSYGAATFFGQGTLVVERYVQTYYYCYWGFDPLAQTFTLTEGRYAMGVDLKFARIGDTSKDVLVQIRETDNGVPTRQVLASGKISGSDLSTANVWTRINFDGPIFLEEDTEYAIVVLTDDANHAVRVAQLGKFDSLNQKWITAQPYTVGVLLSSSNASTWTPHQDMDLTFRLVGAEFTSTERNIDMGTILVTNATHLAGLLPQNIPSGDAEAIVKYGLNTGETFEVPPGLPLPLDTPYTGNVTVTVQIKGNNAVSPIIFPGMQTLVGSSGAGGTYISREFAKQAGGTELKVIYQARTPGASTVNPEYESAAGVFSGMTLSSATQIGDNWVEYTYVATGLNALNSSRVKLTLTSQGTNAPKVRQLRALFV